MRYPVAEASGLPFDDFRSLIDRLPAVDAAAAVRVGADFSRVDNAMGYLGRIEEIAAWLAACTRRRPAVQRPVVAVFAGNHGIATHGLPAQAMDATQRLVDLAAAGGSAVNQICVAYDLGLKLYDLALDLPTADFTKDAALDERACAATMAFGMEAVAGGIDLLALGGIGVGGKTAAAAIAAALFGGSGSDWIMPSADSEAAAAVSVIDRGLALHASHLDDPLEVLRRFGGREFAATAGAILAARMEGVAVILDGFVTTAAAAVLHRMNPSALDHCLLAHVSPEPGHRRLAQVLGLKPLLDLGIGAGEGTAAGLAAGLVKASAQVHSGIVAALPRA